MTRLVSKWTHSCTTFSGENQRYDDLKIKGSYCSSEWKQGEGVGNQQESGRPPNVC